MAIQDERFTALRAQGFTGTNNDMLVQWAQAAGATSNQINDAVLEALLLNGATSPNLNDAWVEYLNSIGLTGARNDMELGFWESGGVIAPVPPLTPIEAHWARVQDKSDPTLLTHLTTLFNALIANGSWDKLTDLCVLHSSADDSLLGLKGVVDSVDVNHAAFIADQGYFAGDDNQDRMIDTGIAKNTPIAGMDDDSMSAFFYRFDRTDGVTGDLGVIGARDGNDALELAILDNTENDFTAGNSSVSASQSDAESRKFIGVSRPDANTVITIRGGNSVVNAVASNSGAPTTTLKVGGSMVNGTFNSAIGTDMTMAWGAGAGMTEAELQGLNAAIDTYVASRTGVIPESEYTRHAGALIDRRRLEYSESNVARLFEKLQDGTLYDKFDEIWVNHSDGADMRTGIKGLSEAIRVGSPQWAEAGGYLVGNGGGTAAYLRTGIFDDGTTQFTDDSMSLFIWRRFITTDQTASDGTIGVFDGGGRDAFLGARGIPDLTDARFGHPAPNESGAGSGKGFACATQNSNNSGVIRVSGVSTITSGVSSAGSPKTFEIYAGGINNQGSYEHFNEDERLAAWGIGGGLTEAETVELETIITNYLTGIGSV